jgi:hypothetical protein
MVLPSHLAPEGEDDLDGDEEYQYEKQAKH